MIFIIITYILIFISLFVFQLPVEDDIDLSDVDLDDMDSPKKTEL